MKWLWPKNKKTSKTSMTPTTPLPLLFLGRGGQGIVFGPFSHPQLLDSLSVPLSQVSQLSQQTQFILKFTLFPMKRDDADAIRDQNKKEVRLLKRMLGSSKGSIILPRDYLVMTLTDILRIFGIPFQTSSRSSIEVNKRSWKRLGPVNDEIRPWIEDGLDWLFENPDEPNGYYIVEIQPFGGMDFFEISTNLSFPWSYSMFLQLWTTWLEALYACLKLIMKHHLFVSDLKPENMVYNPHEGLRLIDVDVMSQSSILEGFQNGSLEMPVISVSALVLPVQMINPLFFSRREMDGILRTYLYRCNKNRDLLKSMMNEQGEDSPNDPCSSKNVRSWERSTPISKRIEDLAILNVYYPMMMSMLLFIRQLEIYQRNTRSEIRNSVMMRRVIPMVKTVLRYLLRVRMKNVDPERVLMMLSLLPSLTDDSKMFKFILEYLKTKDEKIWKQLKGRYDKVYQSIKSNLLLPDQQRKEKVLGQQVRQNYF